MHLSAKYLSKIPCLLLALCLLFPACKGQENRQTHTPSEFPAPRIDTSLNFSSRVSIIFQDSREEFWFVSHQDGVAKYDGKNFSYYTEEQGLPSVRAIYEDAQGQMYFGIQDGMRILAGNEFKHIAPEENSIALSESFTNTEATYESDWEAEKKHFWFSAFNRNGLYRYDGKKLQHIRLPVPEGYPDFSETDGYMEGVGYDIYAVYDIYKDPTGSMWFGTSDAGLFRYDGKSIEAIADETGVVRASFKDSEGRIWYGNNREGIFLYENGQLINFTEQRSPGEDGLASALDIVEDTEGNIWFATFSNGLWKYNPGFDTDKNSPLKTGSKALQHFTKADGLGSDSITSLYLDKEGKVWIGTGAGEIFSYTGKGFDKLE